jgi:hypothetical protein
MCSTIALAACADRSPAAGPSPPGVATIVCDETGTTVETPSVRAQPDGVHVVVDNRTGVDPGFSARFADGRGLGDNAPPGTSEHVLDAPPGTLEIGCYTGEHGSGEPDLRALEVVDVDGLYRSIELDCESMSSGVSDYAPGAEGEAGDPVDLARAAFEGATGGLEPDDVVERAGYPEWDEPIVRLVRAGAVVATVRYRAADDGGGWLQDTMSMCDGLSTG